MGSTDRRKKTGKAAPKNTGSAKTGRGKTSAKPSGRQTSAKAKGSAASVTDEKAAMRKRLRDEIIAIVCVAVGIFFIIAFQTSAAGDVGHALSEFFKGCFGFAAYIMPYYFIVYGVLLFAKKTIAAGVRSVILLIVIFFMISLINSARFIEPAVTGFGFSDIPVHYSNGIVLDDGGAFGMTVGGAIVQLLGIPGLYILAFVVMAVCLLLLMNTPVSRFIQRAKDRKAKHAQEREERLKEKELRLKEDHMKMKQQMRAGEDRTAREAAFEEAHAGNGISDGQKKILDYMSSEDMGAGKDASADETYDAGREESPETEKFRKTPIITGMFSPKAAEEKISKAEAAKLTLKDEDLNEHQIDTENYEFPPTDLLDPPPASNLDSMSSEGDLARKAEKLEDTLRSFNIDAEVTNVTQGPTVTRYEVHPNVGVKVSGITNLANDIALNMEAKSIRIEAPIPGKPAVGIEIENDRNTMVTIREILESREFRSAPSKISFAVGKDIEGNAIVADLKSMPHLLIAGSTGSGKSVCINSIITSLLYKATPDEVKLVLIDPKVVELADYNGIPHLLIPVVTEPSKAAAALNWAVAEMDERYRKFAEASVRELSGYNKKMKDLGEEDSVMPQVVIIIDELADLMMAAKSQVEESICRLAQKARAAGMHLIVATQRPSTDVVTGLIKANIPSRIAFAVSSHHDSMTILDMSGAEKLVGRGDMLFCPLGSSKPLRVQGPFISDREVKAVIDFVKEQTAEQEYSPDVLDSIERVHTSPDGSSERDSEDEFLPEAIELVVEMQQASVSMLQRRFRIGYNRAARIIDAMEERQIVGPADGSRPRQVLISEEDLENMREDTADIEEDKQ